MVMIVDAFWAGFLVMEITATIITMNTLICMEMIATTVIWTVFSLGRKP
jgi:hypothetical protein